MKSMPYGDSDSDLAGVLDVLRQDVARLETPPHVEAAVLAAWDHAHALRREEGARSLWREAAAVAAAAILAVGLGQLGRELHRTTRASVEPTVESRTLLLVGEPILQGEPVRVVRMRVPASTLTELGVRSATGDVAAHVDVDLIVGEDGIARAIRVGM
jgi:hypothetical protein